MEGDHTFGKGTRRHVQPTLKKNCQAKVKLRRIIKFPEYKVSITFSFAAKLTIFINFFFGIRAIIYSTGFGYDQLLYV